MKSEELREEARGTSTDIDKTMHTYVRCGHNTASAALQQRAAAGDDYGDDDDDDDDDVCW